VQEDTNASCGPSQDLGVASAGDYDMTVPRDETGESPGSPIRTALVDMEVDSAETRADATNADLTVLPRPTDDLPNELMEEAMRALDLEHPEIVGHLTTSTPASNRSSPALEEQSGTPQGLEGDDPPASQPTAAEDEGGSVGEPEREDFQASGGSSGHETGNAASHALALQEDAEIASELSAIEEEGDQEVDGESGENMEVEVDEDLGGSEGEPERDESQEDAEIASELSAIEEEEDQEVGGESGENMEVEVDDAQIVGYQPPKRRRTTISSYTVVGPAAPPPKPRRKPKKAPFSAVEKKMVKEKNSKQEWTTGGQATLDASFSNLDDTLVELRSLPYEKAESVWRRLMQGKKSTPVVKPGKGVLPRTVVPLVKVRASIKIMLLLA
jgi:hypothetical protein